MSLFPQPMLWQPDVAAIDLQALYVTNEGWQLRIRYRLVGCENFQEPASWYSELTSSEALDVLSAELEGLVAPGSGRR